MLTRKVPTDDGDSTQPRHSLSVKNRLLVFQDLVGEVISGLVPVWEKGEQGETNNSAFRVKDLTTVGHNSMAIYVDHMLDLSM